MITDDVAAAIMVDLKGSFAFTGRRGGRRLRLLRQRCTGGEFVPERMQSRTLRQWVVLDQLVGRAAAPRDPRDLSTGAGRLGAFPAQHGQGGDG